MNKFKTFFTTLIRTFSDPSYYNDVVAAPGYFSFKYFGSFYILASILSVAIISSTLLPELSATIDNGLTTTIDRYPENLEIHFDTESAEISVIGSPEPVIIPLPENQTVSTDIHNFLVIDTSAAIEDFSRFKTAILLTKTNLVVLSENNDRYQVVPLSEIASSFHDESSGRSITNITLNKSFLVSNLPLVKSTINQIIKIAPFVLVPLFFFGYLVSRLIYVAFMTLLSVIISVLTGRQISYGKLFQIGLHTITVADAITKLQHAVFQNAFPSLYSFAFLGITFIAILGVNPKSRSTRKPQ